MQGQRSWRVKEPFFFDGAWYQERLNGYAFIIEGKKRKANCSIFYSRPHSAYSCPLCNCFFDRDIDTVSRHALHCSERKSGLENRGWWPSVC
ncbi:unnamed protein product [Phytomonas sp. EM1]|nr:unnamed protein product [Phytomonas sp. EM1]|eukprot:CCW63472.1 unnamed protein product [Phytomonas sp. isolate EM1]